MAEVIWQKAAWLGSCRSCHIICHVMAAAVLDLIEPEIAPCDPPILKTLPRIKHEVDRTTRFQFQRYHLKIPRWRKRKFEGHVMPNKDE